MDALRLKLERIERRTPTVAAPKAAVKGAHWVTPSLSADIAYAEITPDGLLRHASFIGLADHRGATVSAQAPIAATGVTITHRSRIVFPESSVTKGDLADYYTTIAPLMLPFLRDRPISLVRCPQGRGRKCFFQKHAVRQARASLGLCLGHTRPLPGRIGFGPGVRLLTDEVSTPRSACWRTPRP